MRKKSLTAIALVILMITALGSGGLISHIQGVRYDQSFYAEKSDSLYQVNSLRYILCERSENGGVFTVRWVDDTFQVRMTADGEDLSFVWSDGFTVNGKWQESERDLQLFEPLSGILEPTTANIRKSICPVLAKIYYGATERLGNPYGILCIPLFLLSIPMILFPGKMLTLGWQFRFETEPEPTRFSVKISTVFGWLLFSGGLFFLSSLFALLRKE